MIIWTIQPYTVYQELINNGYFYCDPKQSLNLKDDDNFRRAYRWMIHQMTAKIGPAPKKNCYPIWAWYRSDDYKHQRPDFRWVRTYSDEVCIELEISESKVLLSEFEAWHFVLNDWYYSPATSKEEWERTEQWFDSLPKEEQQKVKEKSWQRIFDITPRYGEWTRNDDCVQACFWSFQREQIRKVWHLKKGERVREIYPI